MFYFIYYTFLESGVSLIDNESTMHLTISSDFSALSIQNIIASPIDFRSVVKFFNISSNFSFFLKNFLNYSFIFINKFILINTHWISFLFSFLIQI
jgi:hypothetical protein